MFPPVWRDAVGEKARWVFCKCSNSSLVDLEVSLPSAKDWWVNHAWNSTLHKHLHWENLWARTWVVQNVASSRRECCNVNLLGFQTSEDLGTENLSRLEFSRKSLRVTEDWGGRAGQLSTGTSPCRDLEGSDAAVTATHSVPYHQLARYRISGILSMDSGPLQLLGILGRTQGDRSVNVLRNFGLNKKYPADLQVSQIAQTGSARSFHFSTSNFAPIYHREEGEKPPRLLVVQPRIHPRAMLKAKLLEAMRLADSLQGLRGAGKVASAKQASPFVLVQSPRSPSSSKRLRAGAYFGPGTIDIVRAHVDAAAERAPLDAVFVNANLSGVQQRNLEAAWDRPVLDRVGLIIEIFGAHAQTKEAKLQVELAALNYKKTRLVRMRGKGGARLGFGMGGEAEVVSARGRASGAIGGAGETELQLQRRRIGERRNRLKELLLEVRRTRSLHRAARQRIAKAGGPGLGLPVIAVVGYTNAGKSSMVAALSQSNLYVDDRLFATLDSRARSVVLPSGQRVLLSDTVGFISDLPIQLVEAFQATLEEVVEADFLLHVIDSSAPNADEQREAVLQVLREIGVPQAKLETCMVEAWNKVDLVQNASGTTDHSSPLAVEGPIQFSSFPIFEGEESEDESATVDDNVIPNENVKIIAIGGSPVQTEMECKEQRVIQGFGWSNGGVARVSTSAAKGIGLDALLELLDRKLSGESNPDFVAPRGSKGLF